jgi:small-conductance mechanosensitive channel
MATPTTGVPTASSSTCTKNSWNSTYCSCEPPPSDCLLWGVTVQWLIITLVLWAVALLLSGRLVDLLVALIGLLFRRFGYVEWTRIIKKHMVYWTTWVLRWGLFWAGWATLQTSSSFYSVFVYFLRVPFFLLLFPFVNALFEAGSLILRDYIRRQQSNSARIKQVSDKSMSSAGVGDDEGDLLEPLDAEDEQEGGAGDELGSSLHLGGSVGGGGASGADEASTPSPDSLVQTDKSQALEELVRVVKYLAFLLLFTVALVANDVQVVQFFASASLLTVSIIFAGQPWIRNMLGGLMIFFDDKFKQGEYIRVVGVEGRVLRITLRSTALQRADNSIVFVPNSRVMEQPLTNLSRRRSRLIEIRVQLSRKTPAALLRKLIGELERALRALHPSLTSHPANRVGNQTSEDGGAEIFVVLDSMYELLVWTSASGREREEKPFADIQSEVMLAVTEKMDELGVRRASEEELNARAVQRPLAPLPEQRSIYDLHKERGAPFSYTGVDEDFHNDDVDMGMATTYVVYQSGLLAGSGGA